MVVGKAARSSSAEQRRVAYHQGGTALLRSSSAEQHGACLACLETALLSKAGVSHAMRSPSLLSKAGVSHRGREGRARRRHRRLHLAPRPPRSVCRPKTPPPGVHPAPRRRLPHRDIAAAAAAASFSPRACIRHGICSTDCMRVSSDGRALPARHVLPAGPGCSRPWLSVLTAGTRLTQSAASTHTAVLAQIAALAVLTVSPAPPPPRPRSGGGRRLCAWRVFCAAHPVRA